ncbi:putative integral membrane protein [Lasiodiplodia theobromae]|uniref:DUF7703 domain-containing protein n=1 Tax=Lasiodiplodia theobromae TaxID=45133 RepID=A0A5N5DCG3_9PEZI|nr:Integral membrane protein [Lasiodiplodia theobromae]KAB2575307.1 hypothetical protein DBV05_g6043 [Lasiodiplodia theobromae]KAF4539465.1 Integral membrane protein [Lasiodiplodia theobromae]KAF9639281.1 putative integral membrane protein [Lasiodiplodia theobromae]
MASDGVTGAANVSTPILMTMAGFLAISFYNVVELFVIIFTTFKQRSGLYFWSFIVATLGIAPHALGFVLKFFGVVPASLWWIPVLLVAIGFPAMVTGQSVVLYSRLHLVMHDARKLRLVLYMIIFDGVVMSVPLIVMAFGSNSPNPAPFLGVFTVWDKIQIAVFAFQEILISVLYIYETTRLLQPSPTSNRALRKILYHLVAINAVVLAFDVTLLGVQYSNQYEIQTTYKGAVYSIKLKLEFSVLNNLISVIKDKDLSFGGRGSSSVTPSRRFDTFTFNNRRSKGSADYGVFSRIEESGPGSAPKDARAGDDLVIERVKYVGANEAGDAGAERLDSAAGQQGGIGIAFQPTKPLRPPSPSQASELELVMLPETGRIVPKSSIPAS